MFAKCVVYEERSHFTLRIIGHDGNLIFQGWIHPEDVERKGAEIARLLGAEYQFVGQRRTITEHAARDQEALETAAAVVVADFFDGMERPAQQPTKLPTHRTKQTSFLDLKQQTLFA